MRRALLTTLALGGMLVGTAAPAAAAPPERMKESGSFAYLSSTTGDCREQGANRTTCSDITLDASTTSQGTVVCVNTATYALDANRERFKLRSSESGCTEVDASTLTVTDRLVATLAPTTVTLEGRGSATRQVTVSAQDSPIGPIGTSAGRGTFTDGTCTFRYSYTEQSAEVAGTITLDGTTFHESGFAGSGENTVTQRCK